MSFFDLALSSVTTRWAMPVELVDLLGHRPVLDQVLVLNGTGLLGDDRAERRIPLGDAVAAADDMAALAQQVRAVRHAVRRKLAPVHVEDRDLARARQRQVPPARVDDRRHVAELDGAVDRRLEVRLLVELRRAADVEGPHRQLGARLADRLGGDHSDRFADVYRRTAGEVTSVALGADALLRRADQRRADLARPAGRFPRSWRPSPRRAARPPR